MADSCCIVELKETIEKLNIELSQSHAKIAELNAKVREQEEENTRLTRYLKECEEKCRATQERLKFAEQKLAQFSHKSQTTAAQIRRNLIIDRSCSSSDGPDSDENSQNLITDSSSSCSDGPDSDEDMISFPLVIKYKKSGVGKSVTNIPHLLKRKKFDEGTKENNVKTSKLTSILKGDSKVNESNEDALDINSLPNEMIVEVFGYLKQNQLGQIASVCRRWNELTKDPLLWKRVNVKIFSSDREENAVAKSFINGLPSCVTSIRLDFGKDFIGEDFTSVHFEKLCVKLHENCPHLEELILARCYISNILPVVINFCTQFLQCVKKLVFHSCDFFYDYSRTVELIANSKIEALDLCNCDLSDLCKTQFSKLLYLKELRLAITNVDDTWFVNDTSFLNQLRVLDLRRTRITTNTFRAIQTHGQNLKDLYLCLANLGIRDFDFSKSVFPHLKTICISGTFATCEDVVSLIQSCPSLENVYANDRVAESFAAHPFVVAKRCKSGIVQAIQWNHNHNVDYLLN